MPMHGVHLFDKAFRVFADQTAVSFEVFLLNVGRIVVDTCRAVLFVATVAMNVPP